MDDVPTPDEKSKEPEKPKLDRPVYVLIISDEDPTAMGSQYKRWDKDELVAIGYSGPISAKLLESIIPEDDSGILSSQKGNLARIVVVSEKHHEAIKNLKDAGYTGPIIAAYSPLPDGCGEKARANLSKDRACEPNDLATYNLPVQGGPSFHPALLETIGTAIESLEAALEPETPPSNVTN